MIVQMPFLGLNTEGWAGKRLTVRWWRILPREHLRSPRVQSATPTTPLIKLINQLPSELACRYELKLEGVSSSARKPATNDLVVSQSQRFDGEVPGRCTSGSAADLWRCRARRRGCRGDEQERHEQFGLRAN